MGIPLNLDFTMGVAKPIDSRFVMTKAQMLAANDAVMPPVYGCWCNDDGKFYIYNKSNTPNTETGKFVAQPDGLAMEYMESAVVAQRSYIEAITKLQSDVENIKNALHGNIETRALEADEAQVHDFLPDHDRSFFCRKVVFDYCAYYEDESLEENDEIVVNGQSFSVSHGTGTETHTIKVVFENGSLNVYHGNRIIGNITDTVILTVEINTVGSEYTFDGGEAEYHFVEYSDVDVKSKNGYPITENYSGEIVYWNSNPQMGTRAEKGTYPTSFTEQETKAVFSLGNISGQYAFALFMSTYTVIDENHSRVDDENIIRYCYMANWDLSKITKYYAVFSNWGVNSSMVNAQINQDEYITTKGIKKLDFTKVKFSDGMLAFDRIVHRYLGESMGSFAGLSDALSKAEQNIKVCFSENYYVRTYGDLTSWDISKVNKFEELFSKNYMLEFVGDVGKWKIEHHTIKNMFRECFKLKGISSEIGNWNVSNVPAINNMFDSTFGIGDNTLHALGKWNTGNMTNMRFVFCYFAPEAFPGTTSTGGVILKKVDMDIYKVWVDNYEIRNGINGVPLTDEQRRTRELEVLSIISRKITDPKTNLSFIEKWNVSNVGRFSYFAANNPYLVELGDLRQWTIGNSEDLATYGFAGFIQYCTALTTFKMPSFPRGTNVTDIVRGCTALANIEVSQLNVEAISFEDCPLTKQSVLNLINAATTVNDTTTITLSTTTYNAVKDDSDVLAAIDAKAAQNIFVVIGDMSEYTITYHYGAKSNGQFLKTETQTYHTGDTIVPLEGDLNYEYSDEPQYAYYSAGTYSADYDSSESYWFNNFDHWANLPATMPAQNIDIYAVYESENDMWHEGYAMDIGEG